MERIRHVVQFFVRFDVSHQVKPGYNAIFLVPTCVHVHFIYTCQVCILITLNIYFIYEFIFIFWLFEKNKHETQLYEWHCGFIG